MPPLRGEPSLPQPPLSQPPPRPPGERGLKDSLRINFSLFSRRSGGRLGEEGRGDEGPGGAPKGSRYGIVRIGLFLLAVLALAAAPPDLATLERALTSSDAAVAKRAGDAVVSRARERGRALARQGSWSHEDVLSLLALQLVDPERFAGDEGFRRRVLPLLPGMLDPQ